jgi:hypothetical protein
MAGVPSGARYLLQPVFSRLLPAAEKNWWLAMIASNDKRKE